MCHCDGVGEPDAWTVTSLRFFLFRWLRHNVPLAVPLGRLTRVAGSSVQ